jgi:hypothetical protein
LGERRNIKNNGVHIGAIPHERDPDVQTEKENMNTDTSVGITIGDLKGLYADLNEKLASDKGHEWHEAFKLFLKKQNPWPKIVKVAKAADGVLAEMIALGRYDWVNEHITEGSFPVPEGFALGSEPKLFHFDRSISSEKAIREMEKQGYRPAMIWDLLDFGAKNPEEQRKYPIVALGSVAVVDGARDVACLGRLASARRLGLGRFGGVCDGVFRFLAVRI